MNLIRASLRNHIVTLVITGMILVAGLYSLLTMPRREDPKITIRIGLVVAFYPGANALQVEEQVARRVEEKLFSFEEVRKAKTFSTSRDGVMIVHVELEEWVKNTDAFWSKLQLALFTLKAIDLPKGVIGPVVDSDFGDTVALLISLESDRRSYAELKTYMKKIEDELRTIRATSKIKRIGEQKEQIYVTGSTEKLSKYGVQIPQVVKVLQSQNRVTPSGYIEVNHSKAPMHTTGLYSSEEQIRKQIVGMSPTGQPVRIGDVAKVERRYQEPTSLIRVNGNKALLLSVEMQTGHNIVEFGKEVQTKINALSTRLPSDLKIKTIANQPKNVRHSVNKFIHEFFIAIIAVIAVTMLLLPFRVAAISAIAIPITVALTFATLNAVGIELHQVSLASLIVVLGLVVDDAIIIADNYVELLDQGVARWDAAWRSASELTVPVLTATATIVAAFVPLAFLSGSVGEFIFSLPFTVAISLLCSFVVAMLLTPFLCYTFIGEGLHISEGAGGSKGKSFSPLRFMQDAYDRSIAFAMKQPVATLVTGTLITVFGFLLFDFVIQKFFPAAERDQFVVEIWMPEGTRLETTDNAVRVVEEYLNKDNRVANYASFVGTSAPRFYYNFNPEAPVENYAMILVNTVSIAATEEMANELEGKIQKLIPAGFPFVRRLQQGTIFKAPVEVRIIGENIAQLRRLGEKVRQFLKNTLGSENVKTDFHEDYYGVTIKVKDEVANLLGFTNGIIASDLGMGFQGMPVSTFWEGDNPLDIMFRLQEQRRESFDDIGNTYLQSPSTNARVPLRELAEVTPEWQHGRIVRRNGVRTLTVLSHSQRGTEPSQVLASIRPQVRNIRLPDGYRVEYGGEYESQSEIYPQMVTGLGISVVAIFLILLFEFKNFREPLVVMSAIPMSFLGAVVGLLITKNSFGFTAFVGMISLAGIVVRNSIILVDYANELMSQEGKSSAVAAVEAGKRRLRPIFLTTMAAAVGVTPMILSRSSLWSPLASVIAFGLFFLMIMTLLVVPVLIALFIKPHVKLEEEPNAISVG